MLGSRFRKNDYCRHYLACLQFFWAKTTYRHKSRLRHTFVLLSGRQPSTLFVVAEILC